ncbi:hypothetical protein DL93DRAFT_1809485 [Clavulina sp. PMI_390]|nr:hypothetical protein DL93DRAFT_1809485 [Clavulina sp. PMI_390]
MIRGRRLAVLSAIPSTFYVQAQVHSVSCPASPSPILEPYFTPLMSTSSPSPIEEQPIEALDAIALEIDNARDLLNLALTCKSLHALVYFRHLRFRVISGRLGDWRLVEVWDLIARDKTLGRSVRVLDLHPLAYTDPRFIIPLDTNRVKRQQLKLSKKERAALVKRTPYEIIADVVEHFVPALANMTRLISFSWREDGPREMFVVGRTLDPLSMLRKLWEGVNGCSNLERLSIRSGPHVDNSFFKMVRMEHVTEFSWRAEGPIEIPIFREFLNRGLPSLRVSIISPASLNQYASAYLSIWAESRDPGDVFTFWFCSWLVRRT